jgi:hypothetical protein
LNILRATAGSFIFGIPPPMTVLVDRDNDVDQPYVQAITDPGSTNDRVYVGSSHRGVGAPVKATIDFSLDGAAGAPVFTRTEIEARTTQDAPPIRPALHSDGTVYGAFYRLTAFNASTGLGTVDVVVVRDDQGGAGNLKFADLTDSSDGLPGRLVVQGRPLRFLAAPNANFGQERLSGSNLSIAVDPNDSDKVYVAWADGSSSADYTLHVQVSNDGGDTWSDTDIRAVTPATNPALAVNDSGTLGFLFQELSGDPPDQRWETHFEFTDDDFNTTSDAFLADVPADTPTRQFEPYLGDYVHLMALGDDFFGIFSANNTPDQNNFPSGVTYQRNTDFDNQTLADVFGNPVAVSIDPFFFKVTPE